MVSAIEQIIKWAQDLPGWQADAVRRLLEQGELTPEDRDEIYQMLKVEAGIETECVAPEFPKSGGFAGTGGAQEPITLHRLLDVQHVNAVENGSTIPFGVEGITVIYGENGSGKSSYARILKRACRARDTKEPIHQNVYDIGEIGPATATIRITDGGGEVDLPWTDGEDAEERLASVTFFDSKCARVIVDENNDAVYIPYGCHVFDGLVELLNSMRGRLQNEQPTPTEPAREAIAAGTVSFKFLDQLSRNTSLQQIDDATKWTDDDEHSLTKILGRIAGSKTKETQARARRMRIAARRVEELTAAVAEAVQALSKEVVGALNGQLDAVTAAEKASALAAEAGLQDEPLPSGNSNEWRILYDAAQEYSTQVAYPDREFPNVADADALCVLCQQPLDDDTRERFLRFKKFIEDRSEQVLRSARRTVSQSVRRLRNLNLPTADNYANVLEELEPDKKDALERTLTKLGSERARLVAGLSEGTKLDEGPVIDNHGVVLDALKMSLETSAGQAEKDADPDALKKLEAERDELASRKALHQQKAKIERFVEQKQLEYKYTRGIGGISSRPISTKSKEIISAVLSPQLRGDLEKELEKLNASHLPLNVKLTGREGGARHRLSLNATQQVKLSEILSEGELCVVAVAGFFAELGGAPAKSPIVLDDPVSSLDHRYSRHIAERLVEEAKDRQVIVFTHNIAFLVEIEKLCAGIGLRVQTVKRSGQTPGYCMEGVPWDAMNVKPRLNHLDGLVNEAAGLYGEDDSEYNKKAAFIYGRLRETWEAFVERELLNQIVKRHDVEVQTKRLREVKVTGEDCARVYAGMDKCSTWMTGHDKSQELGVNRPAPKEIREDVLRLREFLGEMNKRREKTRDERKVVLEPQTPDLG
jgi:energy-coupling factor transporter ATP-binding protein EcfA2